MGLMDKISDKLHHKDNHAEPTSTTTDSTTNNTSTTSHITSPNDTNKTTAPGTGSHGLSTNNYGATPASSGYGSHSTTTPTNVPTSNTTTTAGMAQKARMDADNIPPYGTAVHSSTTANRVDPRVDDSTTGFGRHNEHNSSTVPHSSTTANRVDPRVDDSTTGFGSHNQHNTTSGIHSSTVPHSSSTANHPSTGYNSSSGPHASNMANRADPRVDSDRSHLGGVSGSHGQLADTMSPSSHGAGYGTSAAPLGASSGHTNFSGREPYSSTTSNTHAPLNSSAPGPYGTREDYGSTGPASHTLGPHSSNAANVADPRVHPEPEKMKDHKTVGPHNSDMLNKLDPRVDSDPRNHGYADRDPTHSNTHSNTHSHNDSSRFESNALNHNGVQTGGFVGGPGANMENRDSIPTAGGLPVGNEGHGPYSDSTHGTGLTGSHGGVTGSHSGLTGSQGGLTGSHGVTGSHGGLTGNSHNEPYGASHSTNASHGASGLTGSHGGLTGNSHVNEPYGASHSTTNSSHAYGSNTTSGPHASNVANQVDPRVDSDNSRFASTGHGHGPTTGSGLTGSHTAGSAIHGSTSHHTSSGLPGTNSHHTSSGLPGTSSHNTSSSIPGSFPQDTHHTTSSGIPGTSSHNATGSSGMEFRERELALRQRELELKEREMEHGMRRL
jgi:hypothetical protein